MAGWFGPSDTKIFSPRTWQGWSATGLLVVGIGYSRYFFRPGSFGLPPWGKAALGAAIILSYVILVYFTYDNEA